MTNFIDKVYEKVDILLSDTPPQKFKLKKQNSKKNTHTNQTDVADAWKEIDDMKSLRRQSPQPPHISRCKTCNGHVVLDQSNGDYLCSDCGIIHEQFILDYDESRFHDYESDQEHASSTKNCVRHGIISHHVSKEESFDLSLSRDLNTKYPWMNMAMIHQICSILNKLSQRSEHIFRTQKRLGFISVAYWFVMLSDSEYISPERVCRIFNCQIGQFKKCLSVIRKHDMDINDYLTKNMNDIYIKMYVYDKLYENKILPTKYADGIIKMFYSVKTDLKISKQTLAYVCCYLYMNQKSIVLKNIRPNVISIAKKIKI